MSTVTDYDYVFVENCSLIGGTRWSWVECFLSDLRAALTGIRVAGGGGNCSFPILVCTGIDFVSDLYAGDTDYLHCKKGTKAKTCTHCNTTTPAQPCPCPLDHSDFKQTEAACEFIEEFFDGVSTQIPHLIWDGLRNGLTHMFMPKPFQDNARSLKFTLLSGPLPCPSILWRDGDAAGVAANTYTFFEALERAIRRYEQRLRVEPDLQARFQKAWDSVESYTRAANGDYLSEMNLVFSTAPKAQLLLFDPATTL